MTTHFHSPTESVLAATPASPSALDSRPASLSSRMLQRVCRDSGASRACLLSIRNDTFFFEDGYEMASQVFQNVVSQVFWASERHQFHKVVLGLKEKLCLIIELPGQRQHRKFILALYDASSQVSPYMIGRIEGIAQTWLEIGASQISHIPRLIDACSVCDRIETKQGWMRWDAFLDTKLKLSVSHKICHDCAHDLYEEIIPAAPNSFQI